MAPRTRMPDSFVTQSGWNKISFNIGSKKGSKSSLNTVAKTSKAAAEHFPKKKKLNGSVSYTHLTLPTILLV